MGVYFEFNILWHLSDGLVQDCGNSSFGKGVTAVLHKAIVKIIVGVIDLCLPLSCTKPLSK